MWVEEAGNRHRIADEVTERAMLKFNAPGVEIPYPKRELYIKTKVPGGESELERAGPTERR